MDNLMVKDIEFNGAQLKAVQDIQGIIWVGVKWICTGIGLSQDQGRAQVKKVQKDLLLKEGCVKFDAGVFDPNNETLAIQLDYLPLWLAKISITPKLQKESPELAEHLKQYQLKAKDVLAAAFLKNESPMPTVPIDQQTIQLQLPSYESQFAELNRKIEKLNADVGRFADFVLEYVHKAESNPEVKITHTAVATKPERSMDDSAFWKTTMYVLMDALLKKSDEFKKRSEIMQHIYKYMNNVYGIVWAQEVKEYIELYGGSKPKTIDIVYSKEQYRSIFKSVLIDLVENTKQSNEVSDTNCLDIIIRPLIEKYNDKSVYGGVTYKRVYKHMTDHHNVNWKNHLTRYMKLHHLNNEPNKKILILNKDTLKAKFSKSVEEMLSASVEEN